MCKNITAEGAESVEEYNRGGRKENAKNGIAFLANQCVCRVRNV